MRSRFAQKEILKDQEMHPTPLLILSLYWSICLKKPLENSAWANEMMSSVVPEQIKFRQKAAGDETETQQTEAAAQRFH